MPDRPISDMIKDEMFHEAEGHIYPYTFEGIMVGGDEELLEKRISTSLCGESKTSLKS